MSYSIGAVDCGPAPASLPYGLTSLHPKMRGAVEPFLADLYGAGLTNYFKPAIGRRSLNKQCWAYCAGGSFITDPSRGAHPNGLAIDFHATGPMAPAIFKNSSGTYSKWATGLDRKTHTRVTNGAALELWKAFGEIVKKHPKLQWGGLWKKQYTDQGFSQDQVLLGFDPYHVQLRNYLKYVTGPRYKCVGGKAVLLKPAEAAAAAVKESVDSRPLLWAAGLSLGAFALWRARK